MSTFYSSNLESLTLRNRYYRRVVSTGPHMQVVLQSLPAGHELGGETHHGVAQFFRIERGEGVAMVGERRLRLRKDSAFVVPAGTYHNVWASPHVREPLKFYTVYSAPVHEDAEVDRHHSDERPPRRTTRTK